MPLSEFWSNPGKKVHQAYDKSILAPVAPEYATGEVLLGGAYRALVLRIPDRDVDPEKIDTLPGRLGDDAAWEQLLLAPGGLASPPLQGERVKTRPLRQLMPLVPAISAYSNVRGKKTGRDKWKPGSLLLSVLRSGATSEESYLALVRELRQALEVHRETDDVLAVFVQNALEPVAREDLGRCGDEGELGKGPVAPAWRPSRTGILTPAERFFSDLEFVLPLKGVLTRRQWTVLLEALLRIGLAMHVLWLCRLNWCLWLAVAGVLDGNPPLDAGSIERECWTAHATGTHLLELGQGALSPIRKSIQEHVEARLGINLVLHALEDAEHPWSQGIGMPTEDTGKTPPEAVAAFLSHVYSVREAVVSAIWEYCKTHVPGEDGCSARLAARVLADANPGVLRAKAGFAKNLFEFVRYSLGQLQPPGEDPSPYDQAYLLYKYNKKRGKDRSLWVVQPGPAMLMVLVHACCESLGKMPATVEDFRTHLAHYGIYAPVEELQVGQAGRDLERLGLVVDSPDAGGGRLLVNPF